jgi:hypothetical protein
MAAAVLSLAREGSVKKLVELISRRVDIDGQLELVSSILFCAAW